MTVTEDQDTRGQRIREVVSAQIHAQSLTCRFLEDARAELAEADEVRDRMAELEIRNGELAQENGELRGDLDEFARRVRKAGAEIDRLQSRLRDAEVAMAGMVAELGERRAS